jgi:hypothetical protein
VVSLHVSGARIQREIGSRAFHEWVLRDGTIWCAFHHGSDGYVLRFPDIADFDVSPDGRNVRCHPAPEAAQETVRHLYLNQVLPLALSRQGRLVIHASAIEGPAGAVAFVGASGTGKSTLAAAFARSGHRLLCDDGLLLDETEQGFLALPGDPSIRLWEDSRLALVEREKPADQPIPDTAKSRLVAGEQIEFCRQPLLLDRVYMLGDGTARDVSIAELCGSEALIAFVKHSFLLDIDARDLISAHFNQLSRLVAERRCFRLDYPRRYSLLGKARALVTQHCST